MWQEEDVSPRNKLPAYFISHIAKALFRVDFGKYRTLFSLQGSLRVADFVERPVEMAKLEHALLPQKRRCQQKVFILHGLGGIGKTQLAVEFARQHLLQFSSVSGYGTVPITTILAILNS